MIEGCIKHAESALNQGRQNPNTSSESSSLTMQIGESYDVLAGLISSGSIDMHPTAFFAIALAATMANATPHLANIEARCLSEGARCYNTVDTCCSGLRCQYIGAVNSGVRPKAYFERS